MRMTAGRPVLPAGKPDDWIAANFVSVLLGIAAVNAVLAFVSPSYALIAHAPCIRRGISHAVVFLMILQVQLDPL